MALQKKWSIISGVIVIIIVSAFIGSLINPMHYMGVEASRDQLISIKNSIQEELMPQHKYRCCLEKPCTYCIEKTPGHGEGAICDCLKDIVEGVHPCGECIGEILEGHGNQYLSKYFAKAIAEEVGEEHTPTLKKIIEQKYGTPVEDQV